MIKDTVIEDIHTLRNTVSVNPFENRGDRDLRERISALNAAPRLHYTTTINANEIRYADAVGRIEQRYVQPVGFDNPIQEHQYHEVLNEIDNEDQLIPLNFDLELLSIEQRDALYIDNDGNTRIGEM
jgi:hypothetical protein